MVQQAKEIVTTITPPEPPPRPPSNPAEHPAITFKWSTKDDTMVTPSTAVNIPLSLSSGAHRCTLGFITEAAQELYAKGQLRIKLYAGYLKEKHMKVHSTDSHL